MIRILAFLVALLLPALAHAQCSPLPYTFVPGTTIASAQVNANFNSVFNCANSSNNRAPHVASLTALQASATTTYPNGVWRDDYSAAAGAPPLWFEPQASACSINAGAGDGASQVSSADGKCWIGFFPGSGVDIRQFGCILNDSSDCEPAFAAAISALVPSTYSLVVSGGRIIVPEGSCAQVHSSVIMTGFAGIDIEGVSSRGSCVHSNGNFPVFKITGSNSAVTVGPIIQHLWIQGGGTASSTAHGISWTYVNTGLINDIVFTGTNHPLDIYDNYYTTVKNIKVQGSGGQANNYCIWMGSPTDATNTQPNNALFLSDYFCQSPSTEGMHMEFFAGSTFNNVQVGGSPGIGWRLCGVSYANAPGSQPCEFGNFTNVLSDTSANSTWDIRQGTNANSVQNLTFSGMWAGNSGTAHAYAIFCGGCVNVVMEGVNISGTAGGLELLNGSNVIFSGEIDHYNTNNAGDFAVLLSGQSNSSITAVTHVTSGSSVTGYNGLSESGGSSNNAIYGFGASACSMSLLLGATTVTLGTGGCRYDINGLNVRVQAYFAPSNLNGGTGTLTLAGFPVTIGGTAADNSAITICEASGTWASLSGPIFAQVAPGTSNVNIYNQGATTVTALTNSNISTSSILACSLVAQKP